ncbi:MAG: hypothetical protein H6739_18735 [Alphaproteobacteria bacterium]|nr:hypothetical protein [Alphaproteobacteria bacterium]
MPVAFERDPHSAALIRRAGELGIEVQDLGPCWGLDAVRFRAAGRAVLVIEGAIYPGLSHAVNLICDSKVACKAALEELGIPTPPGLTLPRGLPGPRVAAQIEAFVAAQPGDARFVCKPVVGTNGVGVSMDLSTPAAINRAALALLAEGDALVELQIQGRDLRLHAISGRLVAACVREPASFLGDGRDTVVAHVARKAAQIRARNPQNDLVIDAQVLALLAEQGLTPDAIPAAGQVVRLKRVANVAQGGVPWDVTDSLHPDYAGWMARIAEGTGLSIFALDVMTPDHRAPPAAGAWALEINARPQWLHHTFSEGRQHDIAGMTLRALLGL